MDDEHLQSKINRLSHSEMAKILLDSAANPEVREHIAAAVETSESEVRSTTQLAYMVAKLEDLSTTDKT